MKYYLFNIDELTCEQINDVKKRFPKRFNKATKLTDEIKFRQKVAVAYLILKNLNIVENKLLYDKNGKPYLIDGPYISYAHSEKIACLVVDDYPIGIDVEKINEKNLKYSKRIFTHEEEILFMDKNPLDNFHILWTRKESFIKLFGTDNLIRKINISFHNESIDIETNKIKFLSKKIDGYFITICSLAK